jgi:hypothetical protein
MPDNTYSVTFFLEKGHELGSALTLLDSAREELRSFTKRHPERVDAAIANAQSHTTAAHSLLDSDFYSDHNAAPESPDSNAFWVVGIVETCERLGIFSSSDDAAVWIGTLPGHEDGRYFLDGPCEDIILRDPN